MAALRVVAALVEKMEGVAEEEPKGVEMTEVAAAAVAG